MKIRTLNPKETGGTLTLLLVKNPTYSQWKAPEQWLSDDVYTLLKTLRREYGDGARIVEISISPEELEQAAEDIGAEDGK